MARNTPERGDTLVEVLMAIVILSLVIIGAITMMSRGLRAAQVAVEHTQVRFEMTGQTELLRYMRDAYIKDPASLAGQKWLALFTGGYVNNVVSATGNCTVTVGKTAFYLRQNALNPQDVDIVPFNSSIQPTTYATPGAGMWIEARNSAAGITPALADFQLRGCWNGPGSSGQQQTVTITRFYDPAH